MATIHTHLKRADVAEFVQDGNSLILKLKNGKVIVIKNYFTEDEDEHSDLLFEDGEVLGWLPFLLGGGAAGGIALAAGGSDGDGDKPGSGSDGGNPGDGTGSDKPGSGSDGGNPGGGTGGDKPGSENNAPTAKPEQGFTTDEDTEHKGQIVAEDKDGDELTYKVGEEPKNGQVVVDEKTGEYTYTPNEDFNGDDTFTVVVSDG
ncbi:MAG: BapA prefix-like domain-containing protein, partial [Xanthomonadaceae bacterium]|nr:BapA prefix-like domain-containing protein [Xanthomonadaceae bacterium]